MGGRIWMLLSEYVYVHVCMFICLCLCMCTCACVLICVCLCVCVSACVCTYVILCDSFTFYDISQFHPCCPMWQDFFPFCNKILSQFNSSKTCLFHNCDAFHLRLSFAFTQSLLQFNASFFFWLSSVHGLCVFSLPVVLVCPCSTL